MTHLPVSENEVGGIFRKGVVRKQRGPQRMLMSIYDEWNSRFLVLSPDALEWYAFEYNYISGAQPRHRVALSNSCTVKSGGPENMDHSADGFIFCVSAPELERREQRTFVFACETQEERDFWVSDIASTISNSPRNVKRKIGSPTNFQHVATIKVWSLGSHPLVLFVQGKCGWY